MYYHSCLYMGLGHWKSSLHVCAVGICTGRHLPRPNFCFFFKSAYLVVSFYTNFHIYFSLVDRHTHKLPHLCTLFPTISPQYPPSTLLNYLPHLLLYNIIFQLYNPFQLLGLYSYSPPPRHAYLTVRDQNSRREHMVFVFLSFHYLT